jgi:uncharacterized membrane protein HdeD (DUF308 family)
MDLPLLARAWWVLVIRGVIGVAFGLLAFFDPALTLAVLVVFFGAYALVDGLFAIMLAIRAAREKIPLWPLVLEGIAGILIGIATFMVPLLTAVALETLVAIWAFVTGIFELVAAFRLRRVIAREWILALTGALSILAGIALLLWPVAGLGAIVLVIGAYALAFGILLIVLGFRLRSWNGQLPTT